MPSMRLILKPVGSRRKAVLNAVWHKLASAAAGQLTLTSIHHWSMQWYPKQIGVQFRPSEDVDRGVWPQTHIVVRDASPAMPFIRFVIHATSGSRQTA